MDTPPFDTSRSEHWEPKNYQWDAYKMQAKRITNGSSKTRGRTRSSRGPLVCQVENCNNDLSQLKAYHRRYKICKHHLKVKSIIKEGIQQRFCQQCGRFHNINEFDGLKRSCRIRLKKHNERRRKNTGNARSNRPESARSGLTSSSHTIDSKIDTGEEAYIFEDDYSDPLPMDPSLFSSSSQHPYYPVLPNALYRQGIAPSLQGDSSSTPVNDVSTDSPSETTISDPLAEVYRNFTQTCDPTEFLRRIASTDDSMPMIPEINPLRQSHEAPLTMPLAPQVFLGRPLMDPVAFLPPERSASKPSNCQTDILENVTWSNSFRSQRSSSLKSDADTLTVGRKPLSAVDQAKDHERLALYDELIKMTSLSVKVYSCTPGSLPPHLRNDLLHAVRGGVALEGYMRRGCVNLIMDIFQPASKEVLDIDDVIMRLLTSTDSPFWSKSDMMVQLNNISVFVASGVIVRKISLEKNTDLYPNVQSITPVCVMKNGLRHFTVKGSNLHHLDIISVHCRMKGRCVPVVSELSNKGDARSYCFSIEESLPLGSLKVEVAKRGIIDQTLIVLSVDDESVVKEIETLCTNVMLMDGFLAELGLVIEFRSWLQDVCIRSHLTVDSFRSLLQQSVSSQIKGSRFSFKSCTKAEMNCVLISAQRLYAYCELHRLSCTKDYIWPVFWFATGDAYLEKALTSILDDLCALIVNYEHFKMSIKTTDGVTGVKNCLKLIH